MKKIRLGLFLLILCGVMGLSLIVIKEQIQPPFAHSLAPLFQGLGKPIKSVDRAISSILPIDKIDEKMLGDEIRKRFEETSKTKTPEEEATVRYLNSLIDSLRKETKKGFEYKVFLVDGPPNAFAMPGGVLCVTKGLMEILESEAELVSVLSHEMGHVERGHLFDAARGEMLQRKIQAISVITYATDMIHDIVKVSFSKTQEDEADEYGFRMLLTKGYDPNAMCSAFEKLKQGDLDYKREPTDPMDDFFASHPYLELRIEKFRSRAKLRKENFPNEKGYLGKRNFMDRITAFEASHSDEWNDPMNSQGSAK